MLLKLIKVINFRLSLCLIKTTQTDGQIFTYYKTTHYFCYYFLLYTSRLFAIIFYFSNPIVTGLHFFPSMCYCSCSTIVCIATICIHYNQLLSLSTCGLYGFLFLFSLLYFLYTCFTFRLSLVHVWMAMFVCVFVRPRVSADHQALTFQTRRSDRRRRSSRSRCNSRRLGCSTCSILM